MMLRQHAFSSSELVSLWSKEYLNPPPLRNRIAPIAETRYSDAHATVQCQIQSLQAAEAQRLQKQSLLNLIVPIDKPWSEVGVSVYRVGVGMYHSSVVVDDLEWHFWEGYGVEPIPRYYDDAQEAFVSVDHIAFVTYVPVDTVMISPRVIGEICEELGASQYSQFTYDILRCNCNHFTGAVLQRNRLPFVRNWIDVVLNRKAVINRDNPMMLEERRTTDKYSSSSSSDAPRLEATVKQLRNGRMVPAYVQHRTTKSSAVSIPTASLPSPRNNARQFSHVEDFVCDSDSESTRATGYPSPVLSLDSSAGTRSFSEEPRKSNSRTSATPMGYRTECSGGVIMRPLIPAKCYAARFPSSPNVYSSFAHYVPQCVKTPSGTARERQRLVQNMQQLPPLFTMRERYKNCRHPRVPTLHPIPPRGFCKPV